MKPVRFSRELKGSDSREHCGAGEAERSRKHRAKGWSGVLEKKNSSLNLLSFMESAIEYDFLVLEEFLKEKKPVLDKKDGSLTIGDTKFGKIVLCPLVMDFGYNNINNPDILYQYLSG